MSYRRCILILLVLPLFSSAQSADNSKFLKKAFGTGNTYGHIVSLEINNPWNDTLNITLDPVVIPGKKHYQSYVVPFSTSITILPGSSISVALFGYCLDPDLPACPENKTLTRLSEWYWVHDPTIPPGMESESIVDKAMPCVPGSGDTLKIKYTGLKDASPLFVYYSSLLHQLAVLDSYLPDGVPISEAVQQAIWMVVQPIKGSDYSQHQANEYWQRLAGFDTNFINSPYFIIGTERIWQSALLLKDEYLCSENANLCQITRSWDPEMYAIFTDSRINKNGDRVTGIFEKIPPVPFIPPKPPVPPEVKMGCQPQYEMELPPFMDGGLNPATPGTFELRHRQLLPLVAEGADADVIVFTCQPDENCPESPSLRREGLTSRVRYTWEQTEGPGYLTTNGSDTLDTSYDKSVLWCPPDLTGTITTRDTTVITRLKLTIIDDLPGQPADLPVVRDIMITTSLDTTRSFDTLQIKVEGYTFDAFRQPDPTFLTGTCRAEPLKWSRDQDLSPPLVTDHIALIRSQQRVVLHAADIRDTDGLVLECTSACDQPEEHTELEDEVIYSWRLIGSDNGYFLTGHDSRRKMVTGKEVIYEAPIVYNNQLRKNVLIEVKAFNQPEFSYLYDKNPPLSKAIDHLAIDTLRLQVDCNPNPDQAASLVIIHWQDECKDHDDPDHIEILKNTSYIVPVYIIADECQPAPDKEVVEEIFEQGHTISPKVQDIDPQQDDNWEGYTFSITVGTIMFLVDFGIMVDQGFPFPVTKKDNSNINDITMKTMKSLAKISIVKGLLSILSEISSNKGKAIYSLLLDMIFFVVVKGELPVDNPYWDDLLDILVQQDPGSTREEITEQLLKEFVGENKGWEKNETVIKFELGMIYSLWIVASHATSCLQSCPVTLDHFTWISLGDTDHYYKRTSTMQVIRWEYNKPEVHTYKTVNEKKGPDFD